jgi:hypothetical protein
MAGFVRPRRNKDVAKAAYDRARYVAGKTRRSAQKSDPGYRKNYYLEARFKVFELLGKVCKRCGFLDWRALQIDHIHGNGAAERKQFRNSRYSQLKRVMEHPEDYQLLCANCNWIKRHEEGTIGPNFGGLPKNRV